MERSVIVAAVWRWATSKSQSIGSKDVFEK